MKTLPILSVVAFVIAEAHAIDTTAWQQEQSVSLTAPGLIRLNVSPETMNIALPQLADLRLLSPSGLESPYVIEWPVADSPREVSPLAFKASLTDQSTVLEIETGTTTAIEAVSLESPAASFIKAARIEGSNDGAQWHELAANEVLFRQSGGAGRLRIPFASGSWRSLRITVDDKRNNPVPFTAARLLLTGTKAATLPHAVTIEAREEKPQQTKLTLNLGAANITLAALRFAVGDAVFSRRVTLSYLRDNNGQTVENSIGNADIYRVTADGLSTASLVIPLLHTVPTARVIVTIQNGDSPPLNITGIEAERYPVSLMFSASETGPWKLISGNATAIAPHYDLLELKQYLGKAGVTSLKPGELIANANYKAPATLPELQSEGANIDLAKWRYRRPVTTGQPGVIRVELDALTLAHSQSSLGDLRLIQNEKQIPFLLEHTNASRTMQLKLAKDSDPKRPTVSLWRATMPLDGLPVTQITLSSPTPLFDRALEVWSKSKDQMGNEYRTHLGSTHWTKQAGGKNGELVMSLSFARLPEVFFIETDNGDNPPIEIESVQAQHAVSVVVAKITDSAPVFLYYGNNLAYAPRYDLQLVRAELLSAQQQNATLGTEKVLRAEVKSASDSSVGSPWFWVALGVAIIVLLWVVARMLPATSQFVIVLFLGCVLHAEDKTADTYFRDGIQFFYDAKPKESVAAFDKVIELAPRSAPQLWQRGMSLYYTGEFKKGREQFELHQTVNPHDVENAAWHFICVARAENVESARKALIAIKGDARVPMKEVHELFSGKGNEEAVMKAAENGNAGSEELRNQLCYAHLYLGLYHEALGHTDRAKEHMLKAAIDYKMDHHMGKAAQVHVKLRGWSK